MNTGETIIGIMLIVILGMALVALVFVGLGLDEHIPTYWSKLKNSLKRKTKLEKEIAALEKDIDELKKQIAQSEKLEELKRRKKIWIEWLERDTQ